MQNNQHQKEEEEESKENSENYERKRSHQTDLIEKSTSTDVANGKVIMGNNRCIAICFSSFILSTPPFLTLSDPGYLDTLNTWGGADCARW